MKLVTFGIINCNRLHYLKSCLESLLETTQDYTNKQIIIVDNASVEPGTAEYLLEKEQQGHTVVRRQEREPSNEFAIGLNTIAELAKGDFVVPLQGDMQFVLRGGWLNEYIEVLEANPNIGCMTLDAQRNITNRGHRLSPVANGFFVDYDRPPIAGAADGVYTREIVEMIYPWHVRNLEHEGGQDSETAMLRKVADLMRSTGKSYVCVVPEVPPAIAIYTDPRGTMARIRGNKRYGKYFAPQDGVRYYEYLDKAEFPQRGMPYGIEDMARPIGFERMIDANGNWLKNPIRPDTATPDEWVEL